MDIVSFFDEKFTESSAISSDYKLCKYYDDIYVGYDVNKNVSVVVKAKENVINPQIQKTKLLCVECNMLVKYNTENQLQNGIVHIIKGSISNKKERDIFLELTISLLKREEHTADGLLNAFKTLVLFFSNKKEFSENELTGIYGELYTIKKYKNLLNIDSYWQSQDKMKFDFSFSDKLKFEVKSTLKPLRIHHFKHEQLTTKNYTIYIISYLFRRDDDGTSLYDLLMYCKKLYTDNVRKSIKINLVLKNVDIDTLKNFKFNDIYTESNYKIFNALDVPKFDESTPDGVANAEYDCDLETANPVNEAEFIKTVRAVIY